MRGSRILDSLLPPVSPPALPHTSLHPVARHNNHDCGQTSKLALQTRHQGTQHSFSRGKRTRPSSRPSPHQPIRTPYSAARSASLGQSARRNQCEPPLLKVFATRASLNRFDQPQTTSSEVEHIRFLLTAHSPKGTRRAWWIRS
jgi:hypothetical protein